MESHRRHFKGGVLPFCDNSIDSSFALTLSRGEDTCVRATRRYPQKLWISRVSPDGDLKSQPGKVGRA
jgi:hypothetical protein